MFVRVQSGELHDKLDGDTYSGGGRNPGVCLEEEEAADAPLVGYISGTEGCGLSPKQACWSFHGSPSLHLSLVDSSSSQSGLWDLLPTRARIRSSVSPFTRRENEEQVERLNVEEVATAWRSFIEESGSRVVHVERNCFPRTD